MTTRFPGEERQSILTRLAAIPVAAAGGAVGILILLAGATATPQSERLIRTPEFLVWIVLAGAQTALAALILPGAWAQMQRLKAHFELAKGPLSLATAVFSVLFWLPAAVPRSVYLPEGDWTLAFQSGKLRLIGFLCFLPVLITVLALLLLTAALVFTPRTTPPDAAVRACLQHRDDLKALLLQLGSQVSIATLSLGAMRRAMIAADGAGFSSLLILMYGGYFSALLLLLYLPAQGALTDRSREVLAVAAPLPSPTDASWLAADDKRQAMSALLELDRPALEMVNRSVLLLGPLLAALVSFALG